ncbi:MAG: HDIG domain-containing protein [Clostridia bacterium]|nr:HDIG domain-containing protein [Clostridia bacterium]
MGNNSYGRKEALALLHEYVKSDSLLKHALTVEAVMRHFALLLGQGDVEKWGVVGLLHDIDYERYPEQHCAKAREILESRGWPEDIIHAVQSHGYRIVNDIEPVLTMEKVLYAADELTGLIHATAIVRPGRSLSDIGVSSVKKKWKQKGFAAGVNRDLIADGAKLLGMETDELIAQTIAGMRPVEKEIGLGEGA